MGSRQQQAADNSWRLSNTKHIKLIPTSMRILFQRELSSGKRRGVSISWHAFSQMKDVTLRPYKAVVVSLEEDVFLNNYGDKTIHLIKYCNSKDNKRCTGGQFFFTMDEWKIFWNDIYDFICKYVSR